MGISSTKFRQALQRGEEDEAMNLFMRNPNLKRAVRTNRSFGPNHGDNTAMHYVCFHAMKELLQDLLSEGASPLSKNSTGETAFHLVCKSIKGDDALRRCECLKLLLAWLRENEGNEPVSKLTVEQVLDEVCTGYLGMKKHLTQLYITFPITRKYSMALAGVRRSMDL